jgi:hypothetical protein
MGEDAAGHVYTTNWEQNAILRRKPDGTFETVLQDPRLLWPDTLFLTTGGDLYVISNQLHRQGGYNDGRDLREPPVLCSNASGSARTGGPRRPERLQERRGERGEEVTHARGPPRRRPRRS